MRALQQQVADFLSLQLKAGFMKTVRHRFAVWLIAPLLFSVSIEAQESNRPVVAVFDITLDGLFMTDEAVSRITDVLASSLLKGRQYLVVPREQITKALIEQKLESHKDCYESCQINLLGALAANRLLSSRVTAIENQCTLTIDLYDAASQTLERSEIVRLTDCSESALMVGIGVACDRIGSDTATNKANPTGNSTGSDRPASLQTGYLAINGTPKAAKVLINGPKEFGNNGTFEGVLPVPPLLAPVGEYEVTVSAIDYDSESKSVVVTSDATTTGTFDLIKSLGRVIISELPPFAEFTLECSGSTTHKGTLSEIGRASCRERV